MHRGGAEDAETGFSYKSTVLRKMIPLALPVSLCPQRLCGKILPDLEGAELTKKETIVVPGIGKVRIRLVPTEEELVEAERAKRARGFFLSLVEALLIEPPYVKDDWVRLSEEDLRPLARLIARANNLEPYFKPKREKPFYNAFRNAWRMKRAAHREAIFQRALAAWKAHLEAGLAAVERAYLEQVGVDRATLRELARDGYLLSPRVIVAVGKPVTPDRLTKHLTAEFIADLAESWFEIPQFSKRERIIRDSISAFLRGEYGLSIYGLFPQPEGVLWDYLKETNPAELTLEELIEVQGRTFVTVEALLREIVSRVAGEEELPFYRFVKFAEFIDDGTLNRHAVEHGISLAFATRENALRLILFLDFVHFALGELLHEAV